MKETIERIVAELGALKCASQKEVEDAIATVLVERRNEKTDAIRLSSDGEKVILS